jgi:hypothetical protein
VTRVAGRSQPLWLAFDETGERKEDLAARRVCPALLEAVDPEAWSLDAEDLSTIEAGGSHIAGEFVREVEVALVRTFVPPRNAREASLVGDFDDADVGVVLRVGRVGTLVAAGGE